MGTCAYPGWDMTGALVFGPYMGGYMGGLSGCEIGSCAGWFGKIVEYGVMPDSRGETGPFIKACGFTG
jgi:hypothetical protein